MLVDIRIRSLVITCLLIITVVAIVNYYPDSKFQSEENIHIETERTKGPEALFKTGVQQLRTRNYHEAINSFRNVLKRMPRMPEAYSNIGFAHYELGHYSMAVEAFNMALELNPSQLNAYWGLAINLEKICDIPGALGAMKTYVHLAPANDVYLKRARAAIWEWEQVQPDAYDSYKQAKCA